jgi:phage-related minor tail protein
MANNIAVSITADVADLMTKRAIMSAELRAATKDLNDYAKQASKTGLTTELRASMLATSTEVAKASAVMRNLNADLAKLGPATEGAHTGMAGITRELLVLGREASRGNLTRMAGSATILAQKLAGAEGITKAVAAVMSPLGITIGATAGAMIAMTLAAEAGSEEQAHLRSALSLTGHFAGLTADDIDAAAHQIAESTRSGTGQAEKAFLTLAASGRVSGQALMAMGDASVRLAALTHGNADKIAQDMVKMAEDPAKAMDELNSQYHFLTEAQVEHINTMIREGDTMGATGEVFGKFNTYLSTQTQNFGYLEGAIHAAHMALDGFIQSMKDVGKAPPIKVQAAAIDSQLAEARAAQGNAAKEALFTSNSPDKSFDQVLDSLVKKSAELHAKMAADAKAAQEAVTSEQTIAAAKGLDAQLSGLKSNHEKALAEMKAYKDQAKQIMSDPNAGPEAKANAQYALGHEGQLDAAINKKYAGATQPKAHPPSFMETQEAAFRAQEIASKDFYGDENAAALKFWTGTLPAATKAGAKTLIEVQGKIFDAQKAGARQAYEQHIADLNEQIAADKDSWAKEKADLDAKLAYIASTYGKQSSQYKAAQKEAETAEGNHQARLTDIARSADQQRIEALKASQQADAQIRRANAQTAEAQITQQSQYSGNPLSEIEALSKVAALHQQLNQQDLADLQTTYAAEDARRQADIAAAQQADGVESKAYADAVKAKKAADADFYNQHRVMENQMVNQTAADQQKIAAGWHSMIDPLVQSWGAATEGLIKGTETWHQALVQIAGGALDMVTQAIEKMAEKYIVNLLMGQAEQKTSAAGQVASYAGVAGAAGVASMAAAPFPLDLTAPAFGAAMQATALSMGSFAKGTNVVPHDMIAQIHAGERIVPRADNADLMAAVAGRGSGGGGKGDIHMHNNYSPTIHAHQPPSLKKMLEEESSDMIAFIRTSIRIGSLKFN